jgi:DNA-binding NarL/FixJ family response regulator
MRSSFSETDLKLERVGKGNVIPHAEPGKPNGVSSDLVAPDRAKKVTHLIVIEPRSFFRDCVLASLTGATAFSGSGVATVEEYVAGGLEPSSDVVVLCAIGEKAPQLIAKIAQLKVLPHPVRTVVISDSTDVNLILAAMEGGAEGFMAANISIEVAVHALRLVAAGGQYFPVDILLSTRRAGDEPKSATDGPKRLFTRRQIAVIDAVRRGKANKIIAYELNMCESTVKVHVRNIMKKLNAKNRTEIAYLARELPNEMLGS